MKQYRDKHVTLTKQQRKPDAEEAAETPNFAPFPDPYGQRLKQQACSIAENCDFFAVIPFEKENENGDSHKRSPVEFDNMRTFSMKDRGKNLNLAPVRDSTELKLKRTKSTDNKAVPRRRCESKNTKTEKPITVPQKPYTSFSQYLNLVIPKTTLHRTNIKLDIDSPRENSTAKFDSKRNPHVPRRRKSSTDSELAVNLDLPLKRASSLGSNRASELRLSRTSTYIKEINISQDVGATSPTHAKHAPLNVNRYRMSGQRYKFASGIRASLSSTEISRSLASPSYNISKSCDTEIKMDVDNVKQNRVLPSPLKPFSIRGRTCKNDDQLTIIYRLQKEKERTERSQLAVK
ncbi:hypothetical protein FSP39_003969 [Pinctada imbricata]|uniref:Uncharacterized protein n=1 Tax=Pinctada imbricata TaxID=66713 RepID=A0AA89BJY2_PINIB|nr:hypothetical protein FSP39_003969 [Pinctada imbricata]